MAKLCTSKITLPLSVTTPSRYSGAPPRETNLRPTCERAIGMTSTGNGKVVPKTSTCLLVSTIQINFFAKAATIFSRVNAAPPPLIIIFCGLISSAPST